MAGLPPQSSFSSIALIGSRMQHARFVFVATICCGDIHHRLLEAGCLAEVRLRHLAPVVEDQERDRAPTRSDLPSRERLAAAQAQLPSRL
eukprot:3355668-Pleurochrysis_carterae.AAC.1